MSKPDTLTATPTDFASDYQNEHDGVVRVDTTLCGATGEGSGFLVAPTLVATAAHVVDHETSLAVTDPVSGNTIPGQVVGFDSSHDVALIRTQSALSGHVFTFATAEPLVGSRIGAIGYPLRGPESLAVGSVSGLDRTITTEDGQTFAGLIQTDTQMNPGNSGGPMIGLDGKVEGIADASNVDAKGINYAVSAGQAAPLIEQWRQNTTPIPPASCATGPTQAGPTTTQSQSPSPSQVPSSSSTAGDDAVATVIRYGNLINAGDYAGAYTLLTPAGQQRTGGESEWEQGIAGSAYTNRQVVGLSDLQGGGFDVELTFTSTQPGQACKDWDLDYRVVPAGGSYLIDIVLPHSGSGWTPC